MKIIKLELIKAFSNRRKLFIEAVLIIIYFLMFFMNDISGFSHGRYGWHAYKALTSDYMEGNISYRDIKKSRMSAGATKVRYSHDVVSENSLFRDVYNDITSVKKYDSFIKKEVNPSYFGASDEYIVKRNAVQKKTYEKLGKLDIKFSPLRGIKLFSDLNINIFLFLTALYLFASSLMEKDRKEASGLVSVLPLREDMYKYKAAAGAVAVVILTAVALALKFAIVYLTFGIGNPGAPVQSVPGFAASPLNISAGEYIFLYSLSFIAGACLIFLADFTISVIIKNEIASCLAGIIFNAVILEGVMKISDISNLVFLKRVDPAVLLTPESIFMNFDISRIGGRPVRTLYIEILIFIIMLPVLFCILRFLFLKDVYSRAEWSIFKKSHIRRISGTSAELYKCLVSDRVLLFILAGLAAIFILVPDIPDDRTTEQRAYYDAYLNEVKGVYTSEKAKKLQSQLKELKDAEKMLGEADIAPEAAVVIKDHVKGRKALERLIDYSDYLSEKEGCSFVNEYGPLVLAGMKKKYSADFLYELLFIVLAVTAGVSVWSFDGERKTEDLINTTGAGKEKIRFYKLRAVIVISIITGIAVRLLFVMNVMAVCDLNDFRASAGSIPEFHRMPENMKIWQLTCINGLVKIVLGTVFAVLSGAAVKFTKNRTASVAVTALAGAAAAFLLTLIV